MYVCGITPYDATHLGHAATYVTFDLVGRALRDAGHEVPTSRTSPTSMTRCWSAPSGTASTGATSPRDCISLFREDMTALGVIPPDHFTGVVESMTLITDAVRRLLASGSAYRLPAPDGPGDDIYFDLADASRASGPSPHGRASEMLADVRRARRRPAAPRQA